MGQDFISFQKTNQRRIRRLRKSISSAGLVCNDHMIVSGKLQTQIALLTLSYRDQNTTKVKAQNKQTITVEAARLRKRCILDPRLVPKSVHLLASDQSQQETGGKAGYKEVY